jgi:hypothetical protein
MEEMGVSRDTVVRQFKKFSESKGKPCPAAKNGGRKKKFKGCIKVNDLKKEFDIPAKIFEALEQFAEDYVIKDVDFRNELKVTVDQWRAATKNPNEKRFDPFRYEIKRGRYKGIYWGSRQAIEELEQTIDNI